MMLTGSFLLLLLALPCLHCYCHQNCTCIWRSGKRAVECTGLVDLPTGLDPSSQILDMTGNILRTLPKKGFYHAGLVNLQKVYLGRCGLVEVVDDAFYQLTNLVELDLSHNFLTWVPTVALRDCPHLRRLQLSHNPIHKVDNDSFSFLNDLMTLELTGCQVEHVEASAFAGLKKLQFLKLDGNRLRFLSEESVGTLPRLYALELNNNPWTCDCGVRGVRAWMLERNVPYNVPPTCEQPPRLKNVSWAVLQLDDFACVPTVHAQAETVVAVEGQKPVLECLVKSVPESTVHWVFQGRVVANLSLMSFGLQMYVIQNTGAATKLSSLSISNVQAKDRGRYVCVASNRAGNVSANVTLSVTPSTAGTGALTGGEIVGIVIGLFLGISACFVGVCFFVLHRQTAQHTGGERKFLPIQLTRKFDLVKENHFETTSVADSTESRNGPRCKTVSNCAGSRLDSTVSSTAVKNTVVTFAERPLLGASTKVTVGGDVYAQTDCDDPRTFSDKSANTSYSFPSDVQRKQQQRRSYLEQSPYATLGRRAGEGAVFKYEHSGGGGTAATTVYGTWKRGTGASNPLHLALSPETRDSPDEGLGDEREYETDIFE